MVERYPHTLSYTVTTSSGDSYRDAEGKWITPDAQTVTTNVRCRLVPIDDAERTKDEDTENVVARYVAYAPPETAEIQRQQAVTVRDGARVLFSGAVSLFFPGQLGAKIWL